MENLNTQVLNINHPLYGLNRGTMFDPFPSWERGSSKRWGDRGSHEQGSRTASHCPDGKLHHPNKDSYWKIQWFAGMKPYSSCVPGVLIKTWGAKTILRDFQKSITISFLLFQNFLFFLIEEIYTCCNIKRSNRQIRNYRMFWAYIFPYRIHSRSWRCILQSRILGW